MEGEVSWPQSPSGKIYAGGDEGVRRKAAKGWDSVRRLCQQPREDPELTVGSGGQEGAPGSPRCLVPGIETVKQEEGWVKVGRPGSRAQRRFIVRNLLDVQVCTCPCSVKAGLELGAGDPSQEFPSGENHRTSQLGATISACFQPGLGLSICVSLASSLSFSLEGVFRLLPLSQTFPRPHCSPRMTLPPTS